MEDRRPRQVWIAVGVAALVVLVLLALPFLMMGGFGGMGGMMGIPAMGIGWIVMVLFVLLLVLGVVALVAWLARGAGTGDGRGGTDRPLDILQRRYARGEITREEYERTRADLEGRAEEREAAETRR